jgi:hypothetical protein
MTKSAKQGTAKAPAVQAETEPDATKGAAVAESENGVSPSTEATPEDDAKPDIDDVKARFREALDRKRQVHAEDQGKGGHEAGKVSGAHGPAASRRSFRRKSG